MQLKREKIEKKKRVQVNITMRIIQQLPIYFSI